MRRGGGQGVRRYRPENPLFLLSFKGGWLIVPTILPTIGERLAASKDGPTGVGQETLAGWDTCDSCDSCDSYGRERDRSYHSLENMTALSEWGTDA